MKLLALDPSVRSPGIAVFRDGVLAQCERVRVADLVTESDGERWLYVANVIEGMTTSGGLVDEIVFERPQIYRASKSKGDPNQLIGLAGVSMAIVGLYQSINRRLKVSSPTPAEWCGQIPKATKGSAKLSPRAQRILSRLSARELELVPNQHDAIDAVGLGLWALGRLDVRRVYTTG